MTKTNILRHITLDQRCINASGGIDLPVTTPPLPPEYIDFLGSISCFETAENIVVKSTNHDVADQDGVIDICSMFCITEDPDDSRDLRLVLSAVGDSLPGWLAPIGSDACGNMFCISLRSNAVVFWQHDVAHDEVDFDNLPQVASSFSDFLQRMYVDNRGGTVADDPSVYGEGVRWLVQGPSPAP